MSDKFKKELEDELDDLYIAAYCRIRSVTEYAGNVARYSPHGSVSLAIRNLRYKFSHLKDTSCL